MVGQFFHSLNGDGQIEWQGEILSSPTPGIYQVQLFEWVLGGPIVRRLVKIEDVTAWLFYQDAEQMKYSYEHGIARAGGPYRELGRSPELRLPSIPGCARDYWGMLHSLLKGLAMHAETVHWAATDAETSHVKQALACWSRGIWDTPAGDFVQEDIENLLRINRVAESLSDLWKWYDDPSTSRRQLAVYCL